MKLTILGSGTCVPSLARNASGYLLEADDFRALIDCGSGTLLQLERAGMPCHTIDAVFITHSHPDHFADLMPFMHALLAAPGLRREKPFSLFASGDFIEYFQCAIVSLLTGIRSLPLSITEITESFGCGPFHVCSAKTVHSADSMAFRFEHSGRSVVFSGDADYDQQLIALSENADLLVADCSFPDALKVRGHLCSRECGLIAQKAGVRKLILSHLYPSESPDAERVEEAGRAFSGNILLAEDLMEIEI